MNWMSNSPVFISTFWQENAETEFAFMKTENYPKRITLLPSSHHYCADQFFLQEDYIR